MIKKYFVTGDTHGIMDRFNNLTVDNPLEIGVIILGDAGCNYYLNKKDKKTKSKLESYGFTFYLVRGNHEERPENIETMNLIYDKDVKNKVYCEEEFPHIKYLIDGFTYEFNNHKTLVIGGAYSIDKFYRLSMGYTWFSQEQLSINEMNAIESEVSGKEFDFVLSHTCPIDWEPRDLFIPGINQSEIDKTMEVWLQELKDKIKWNIWLFGHYHDDRLERPHVEMYFHNIDKLDTIWDRWNGCQELEWWLPKSPNYWME